jgi:hypothetical protein
MKILIDQNQIIIKNPPNLCIIEDDRFLQSLNLYINFIGCGPSSIFKDHEEYPVVIIIKILLLIIGQRNEKILRSRKSQIK